MLYIYWVVSIINILYILIKKRRVDLFTIGIITFVYYSYPAFSGNIYIENAIVNTKVVNEVYYFLVTINIAFFIIMFFYDNKLKRQPIMPDINISKYWSYCVLIFSMIFILLDFSISGIESYMSLSKSNVNSSVFFGLAIWGFIISFFLSLELKLKSILIISAPFIIFSLFIGSRAYFATAIIGVILITFKKEVRIIKSWKYLFAGLVSFFFLVFYKAIYRSIKTLDIEIILNTIKNTTFNKLSFFAEANAVLFNLNYTLMSNYTQIDRSPLIYIFQQIPFSNLFLNERYVRFSEIVSTEIHPNLHYGMASNIWAEIYSIFGYTGMYLSAMFWLLLIFITNYGYQKSRFVFMVLPAIIYSTFYLHRLDFSFVLGAFQSCVLVVFLSSVFYYIYLKPFVKSKKTLANNNHNLISLRISGG